jgi:hypothetical protein
MHSKLRVHNVISETRTDFPMPDYLRKCLSISDQFRDSGLTSGFLNAGCLMRNHLRSEFIFSTLSDVIE